MDKILITSFRDEIANAILNMQDKLNPNKDAYIDKNELQGVLDFFGAKDVSSLLKTCNNQSVFGNTESTSQAAPNEDTIELSSDSQVDDEDDAINTYGTAANSLDCRTKANLVINSAGVSYAQQKEALEREMNIRASKKESVADIIYKIDALEELVGDYLKEHPEADKRQLIIKEISYGKNGEKKAILSQSFGINGCNAFDKGTNTDSTESESSDSKNTNNADAEVNYNFDFRTLNDKTKGNWHVKGTINAGSDNSDIYGAFQYTKQFNNKGTLNFTGNLRETLKGKSIIQKNNISSFGASLDYKKNTFSTGAYVMYLKEGDSKQTSIEMYGKYAKSIIASVGTEKYDGIRGYYANGLIQGKRDFENIGLSINGGIGGEYGYTSLENMEDFHSIQTKIRAKGGIAFKSREFSADLSADITKSKIKSTYIDNTNENKITTAAFSGNIITKNVNILTTVSSISVDSDGGVEDSLVIDDKPSITASIMIGFKNIFGKNIMPILRYNTGNYEGASQSVGAGVIISP